MMDVDAQRLALAVQAYDAALQEARHRAPHGRLALYRTATGEDLDLLYQRMIAAAVPILQGLGVRVCVEGARQ